MPEIAEAQALHEQFGAAGTAQSQAQALSNMSNTDINALYGA
jgi:hypothetical protein